MDRISILVVDDEQAPRENLSMFLSDLDYRVDTAEDADSALEKIRKHDYGIIITDQNMPDSTGKSSDAGLRVLKFAAENSPDSQVIVTTGYASLETAIEAMKRGAFDYLIKPFSLDKLEASLARIAAYRSFINSSQTISSYRNLHGEVLDILKNTRLTKEERHQVLRTIEEKIDEFFKTQKRFENIIIEQRDSLANIAMYAGMLHEKLAQTEPSEITELLTKLSHIADRRL